MCVALTVAEWNGLTCMCMCVSLCLCVCVCVLHRSCSTDCRRVESADARYKFSKVRSMVVLHRKYSIELAFQNICTDNGRLESAHAR